MPFPPRNLEFSTTLASDQDNNCLTTFSRPADATPEMVQLLKIRRMRLEAMYLVLQLAFLNMVEAFVSIANFPFQEPNALRWSTSLGVSELHVPGYRESKIPFILQESDLVRNSGATALLQMLQVWNYAPSDFESQVPYMDGSLVHRTRFQVFSSEECQKIVNEAEMVAAQIEWTRNRHGNFPTTDLPLIELPETLSFLRVALEERLYPLLRAQFGQYLPDATKLRVADGFIVKYDAEGGQTELKPHRDGSVLSFNIALNPASEFEGGGTWFDSLNEPVKIDQGEVVSHASALLHGGHGITSGKRYILVAFVILEGYDAWSMRFYNNVRDL